MGINWSDEKNGEPEYCRLLPSSRNSPGKPQASMRTNPELTWSLQQANGETEKRERVLLMVRNQTQPVGILWILIEQINCKKISGEYSRHSEYEQGSNDILNDDYLRLPN